MTEANPLINFVVPCYNYARYIPDCVNSILNQEGNYSFEVILIDDASTDNTPDLINSFSDPRIRVFTNETNLGHAKTIEKGLRLARGKYVARIDPDDRYRPNFLSLTISKFEQYPEVGAVYGDVCLIDETGMITAERADTEHKGKDFKGNELVRLLERNFICAPSLIARREAWLNALPVPSHLAFNDWYFTLMMAREYEFFYVNEVVAEYRVHSENHHSKVVREKTEEPSVFWLLDQIFSGREKQSALEVAKQAAKSRILSAQYLDMAEKYFSCGYNNDARRCYFSALRFRPASILRAGPLRRLAATIFGRRVYESSKSSVKAMRASVAKAIHQ